MVIATPRDSIVDKGLRTELCSMDVVITWSPFLRTPLIAIFSDSVQFFVKTIFMESSILKNSANNSLVSKIISALSTAML